MAIFKFICGLVIIIIQASLIVKNSCRLAILRDSDSKSLVTISFSQSGLDGNLSLNTLQMSNDGLQ